MASEEEEKQIKAVIHRIQSAAPHLTADFIIDIANAYINGYFPKPMLITKLATECGLDNFETVAFVDLINQFKKRKELIINYDVRPGGMSYHGPTDGGLPEVEIEEWVPDGKGGGDWIKVKRGGGC